MMVSIEAFANLQYDFGAADCRDSFIMYLQQHESQINPDTHFQITCLQTASR